MKDKVELFIIQSCDGFGNTNIMTIETREGEDIGVLYRGGRPSLFEARNIAKSAIARTKKYCKKKGFGDHKAWQCTYRIVKIKNIVKS